MLFWTALILSYCIGSLSTSIILCKIMGLPDPRSLGSKSAGATNMLRFAGKKLALLTLLGDMLKGVLAVLIGRWLSQSGLNLGLIALAALIGHIYPIFFKFHGGKGVATGFGGLLALSPLLGIAGLITWFLVAIIFRYSSLASLVSFSLVPFYALFFKNFGYFIPLLGMSALILFKHRANLSRLKAGTEPKIQKPGPA